MIIYGIQEVLMEKVLLIYLGGIEILICLLCDKRVCIPKTGDMIGNILLEYVKSDDDDYRIKIANCLNSKGYELLVEYMFQNYHFCYILSFFTDLCLKNTVISSKCYDTLIDILNSELSKYNNDNKYKIDKNAVILLSSILEYPEFAVPFLDQENQIINMLLDSFDEEDEEISTALINTFNFSLDDYQTKLTLYIKHPNIIKLFSDITCWSQSNVSLDAVSFLITLFRVSNDDNSSVLDALSFDDLIYCFNKVKDLSIIASVLETINNRLESGLAPIKKYIPFIIREGILMYSNKGILKGFNPCYVVIDDEYIYQFKYIDSPPIAKYAIGKFGILTDEEKNTFILSLSSYNECINILTFSIILIIIR